MNYGKGVVYIGYASIFLGLLPVSAVSAPLTAEQLLDLASLNQQLEDLTKGKIVAIGLSEVDSDTELKVLMSILVPASLNDTVAVLQEQSKVNGVLTVEEIGTALSDAQLSAVFAKVAYSREEIEEVRRLLKISAGSKFNFSPEETSLVKR